MAGTSEANSAPTPTTSVTSPAVPAAPTVQSDTSAENATSAASNEAPHVATGTVEAVNDDDGEEVVTLHEVLRLQTELNDTAEAVLGDASDEHCSYELGYYRQALYACLTCTPGPLDSTHVAGICLACSYQCHTDHELVELYTKREFRCDCGNARFPETSPCTLLTEKDPLNDRNVYSQNFVGTYCTCHRPYPDPERVTPEIMVQCIVCEDWLHQEHIFQDGRALPETFDEMICHACMSKHPFLVAYQALEHEEEPTEDDASLCVLEKLQQRLATQEPTDATVEPTFWSFEWRSRLCGCTKCIARMEKANIAYLMDPEDTLQAYEERAKQQTTPDSTSTSTTTTGESGEAVVSSSVESAMSTLEEAAQRAFQSKLTHEQQVEMAVGYNHMKEKLQSYLATFAATGKTVRAEDIQGFFEDLRATKRPRHN